MLRLDIDMKWNGRPTTRRERSIVLVQADERSEYLKVTIDAPFHGDQRPEGPAGSTPGLWEHEVVELFIAGADGRYLELEFGPYGHYLVLSFTGVRQQSAGPHELHYRTVVLKHNWVGTARIPRALLPEGPHRINATAIHGHKKHRRFLSATVLPGDRPDFHQPEHFMPVELP